MVFCISCWIILASATLFAALLRSWSHQGLALEEGRLSFAERAIASCIALDKVSVYSSSWAIDGSALLWREVRRGSVLFNSWLKCRDHSEGSTLLMLYLMPSILSISCLLLSMVNLIALWSESWASEGSMDQSLNVLRLMAVMLANDRSMTNGHSPLCRARWVIAPFLLSRLYLL